MSSPEFVRAKLVSRTNAACSSQEVKNNRVHYYLRFEKSIGWDWLQAQVDKTSHELSLPLEVWEIHPSGVNDYEIEVREVDRRPGIDGNQRDLKDFER